MVGVDVLGLALGPVAPKYITEVVVQRRRPRPPPKKQKIRLEIRT